MICFAGFGRRAWAVVLTALVDLFVLGTLGALVPEGRVAGPMLLWILIHHVGLVCEGGTLGHRLAGLRVVRVDGRRVSVGQALGRLLTRWSLSVPSLGLGFLWMLDEPQRRTWHDLLAGTVVVREVTAAAQLAPAWAASPPWRAPAEPAAPVEADASAT